MSRKSSPTSPLLALLLLLIASPVAAATITATSCNNTSAQPHVQNAVTSAVNGDTIVLPAGTCSWSVNITTSKRLKFQGNGIGSTIITDDVPKLPFPAVPQALIW